MNTENILHLCCMTQVKLNSQIHQKPASTVISGCCPSSCPEQPLPAFVLSLAISQHEGTMLLTNTAEIKAKWFPSWTWLAKLVLSLQA